MFHEALQPSAMAGNLMCMNTKKLLPNFFKEGDTYKVLEITIHFMNQYFGHPEATAGELMVAFFTQFDEDVVHHDSAYRMAAYIHYISFLKGDPNKLGDWMLASGVHQTPPEATEYFREHYFNLYNPT